MHSTHGVIQLLSHNPSMNCHWTRCGEILLKFSNGNWSFFSLWCNDSFIWITTSSPNIPCKTVFYTYITHSTSNLHLNLWNWCVYALIEEYIIHAMYNMLAEDHPVVMITDISIQYRAYQISNRVISCYNWWRTVDVFVVKITS